MAYQPTPFSLIMPEVPAHITDNEIAYIWDIAGRNSVCIRSIQMGMDNRVTIHFDDFNGYGIELRESIMNGYYSSRLFDFNDLRKGQLPHAHMPLKNSYLLPCETPQPPRTEYSHVVALQLQDVVRKQAEQIQMLEARLQSHKEYSNDIHDMIIALEAKREAENKLHAEEYAALNNKLAAVIDWCSQPVWRRKFAAFVSPK